MRWYRLRASLLGSLVICFLLCIGLGVYINRDVAVQSRSGQSAVFLDKLGAVQPSKIAHASDMSDNELVNKVAGNDAVSAVRTPSTSSSTSAASLNYNVHVFYYVWYGTPALDGSWLHWAHQRLPHWDKNVARNYRVDYHKPPDDIGSSFYPKLGPYSSRDEHVIEQHMQQIVSTGAGVLAVSWYPPGQSDDNGVPWDDVMTTLLDAADRYQLKICFHIEPFTGRSAQTFQHWIRYIIDAYGSHPAFYRIRRQGQDRPLFYLYDSYQVAQQEWRSLLVRGGEHSVRGTSYDGVFVGLLVEQSHARQLDDGGFDGYYTYFASDGFTYGSTTSRWHTLSRDAATRDKLFIPSVGPGYIDESVRPWNARNTKERGRGKYFRHSWSSALACRPSLISVTSFNEWHEGTQIESAVPKQTPDVTYLDYSPDSPDFYLQLTRHFVQRFEKQQQ